MTENNNSVSDTNETENQNQNTATTPEKQAEITIPVKYNKELIELDVERASNLAQKGLKFEVIQEDYETLKKLACGEKKSITQFLSDLCLKREAERKNFLTEKCGGDSQMAEHIFSLEEAQDGCYDSFAELKTFFPEIKTEEDLPQEVLDGSKLKGTLLLDEYLRYRLKNEMRKKEDVLRQKNAQNSSLGSQINRTGAENPVTEEFLKGLWK